MRKLKWLCLCVMLLSGMSITCKANDADAIPANMMITVIQEAKVYEEPSNDSKVIGKMKKDSLAFTQEESSNGWCKLMSGDVTGYVKLSSIALYQNQEISDEMSKKDSEYRNTFNEVMKYISNKKKNVMWGIMIAVLVVGIFVVGITSAIKESKKNINEKIQ